MSANCERIVVLLDGTNSGVLESGVREVKPFANPVTVWATALETG